MVRKELRTGLACLSVLSPEVEAKEAPEDTRQAQVTVTDLSAPEEDESGGGGELSGQCSLSPLWLLLSLNQKSWRLLQVPERKICISLPDTKEHRKATTILLPDFLGAQWKHTGRVWVTEGHTQHGTPLPPPCLPCSMSPLTDSLSPGETEAGGLTQASR